MRGVARLGEGRGATLPKIWGMWRLRTDSGIRGSEMAVDPVTGILRVRFAPTWVGVREYVVGGKVSREFHSPEDVCDPNWIAALKNLPCPLTHPEEGGIPLWLHVDPRARVPEGYRAALSRDWAVGWTGTEVEMRPCAEWPEIEVPTVVVSIHDHDAIRLIRGGMHESSLQYAVWVDETPGVWVAPDGTEHPYDARHRLNIGDYGGKGRPMGPNHLAILPEGRGGAQSRVRMDAKIQGVKTTKLIIPLALRADSALEEVEITDEPAAVATLQTLLNQAGEHIASAFEALAEAKKELEAKAAALEAAESKISELEPAAEMGTQLDMEMARREAEEMGLEPKGDSAFEIRKGIVAALRPEIVERYKDPVQCRVAVDAALKVLKGTAKLGGKSRLVPLAKADGDNAPAPKRVPGIFGRKEGK